MLIAITTTPPLSYGEGRYVEYLNLLLVLTALAVAIFFLVSFYRSNKALIAHVDELKRPGFFAAPFVHNHLLDEKGRRYKRRTWAWVCYLLATLLFAAYFAYRARDQLVSLF